MNEPVPPRTVRPRKSISTYLPIIAVDSAAGEFLLERTGEVMPFAELPAYIIQEPSSLVVVPRAGALVRWLDGHLSFDPRWQYRVSPVHRENYRPNRERGRITVIQTVVAFFGFGPDKHRHIRPKYHHPLDPGVFIHNKTIGQLRPNEGTSLERLLAWGADVREFLGEQGLKVRPTAGGLAGQLLRDKRFYPNPRRKVPRATNTKARPHLPGNFYRLYIKERKMVNATYLDMQNAHHNCARGLRFPLSDSLFGRGYFRQLQPERVYSRKGSPRFRKLLACNGLFYGWIRVPHLPSGSFPPPFMEGQGTRRAYFYSNEIPSIYALGGEVESIIAAWVSPDEDPGLNRYAEWALGELARTDPVRREWLKPTLLSTYGILAAKPRIQEFGFRTCKRGTPTQYPVGTGMLNVQARRTSKENEMPTANVIHRGMIEAETRKRGLDLARDLHSAGHHVISVYADSVFVETDEGVTLPFLPEPWTVKQHLTSLRFYNPTSFVSRELQKLPGVPRRDIERLLNARRALAVPRKVRA